MKLAITAVLCLSLLFNIHFSLAMKKTKLSEKLNLSKKTPKIKLNGNVKSKSKPQFNFPKRTGGQNPGSYPRQPGYPAGGYPAGGYPAQGFPYGGQGGYGGYGYYGGYPGGYINHNPNNRVLSPHYGGSFGYGGYGAGHGSPFSHSVQQMGVYPKDQSRGFGRSAVLAAAGGAVAGMAVGYGLGRFPRPHFHFHSPQEEYYYNHYMYRKYGVKSTDTDDYSRDYKYSPPPVTYDGFMDSCMKRSDLLPGEKQKPENQPATSTSTTDTTTATTTATNTTTNTNTNTTTPTATPNTDTGSNTTEAYSGAAGSSTSAPSAPRSVNQSEAGPVPELPQAIGKSATDDDDDDTVSIVEIGYPALIKQLKVRRCLQLYMVYSEKYLKKTPTVSGGVQGLELGLQGVLAGLSSSVLMLLNSNMLMLLH